MEPKESALEAYKKYKGEVAVMQNDDCISLLLQLSEHAIRETDSPEIELLAKVDFVKRDGDALSLSEKGSRFLSLLDVEVKTDVHISQEDVDRLKKIDGYLSNTLPPETREAFELQMFENEELLNEVSLVKNVDLTLRNNADFIFKDLLKPHQVTAKRRSKSNSKRILKPINVFEQEAEELEEAYA